MEGVQVDGTRGCSGGAGVDRVDSGPEGGKVNSRRSGCARSAGTCELRWLRERLPGLFLGYLAKRGLEENS